MLELIIEHYKITEIVSGGANGADKFGENFANKYKLDLTVFYAQWNKYDIKAGPLQNRQMAEYTDYAILFPGGRGTDSMRKEMLIHRKKILYDAEEE